MTCFRRKGNIFVHTAPRIRSAVFRILTGFPCSAEQECVSHISIRSRICHKVSRIYRKPPNGGGSYFAQCRSVLKRSAPGNLTAGRGNNRQSSIKGLCKRVHKPSNTNSFCVFLFGLLLKLPLVCQNLLLRFSLSVNFFLLLKLFLDSCKRFTLICCFGSREPRQEQCPIPGPEPLLNKLSADDFSRPRGMLLPNCPGSQISKQLFIRILRMLLPKGLFLLFQRFLDHPSNGCFVYILSSGICHDYFLSKQKLRQ